MSKLGDTPLTIKALYNASADYVFHQECECDRLTGMMVSSVMNKTKGGLAHNTCIKEQIRDCHGRILIANVVCGILGYQKIKRQQPHTTKE